jgi:two-component system, chemotaxis family, protein-glutamate methylesterase/glutaminase
MAGPVVVVIGASAGGVEALVKLVGDLSADLPAMVGVVVHFPAQSTSVLPDILNRAGPLPAVHARQGLSLQPGQIVIAPQTIIY